jgi:hypothetical protein
VKTSEIDELIARAEAGEQITISLGRGPARPVHLDDLYLARGLSAYLDAASRLIEQAAADLDFELYPPDAAERAGFAKPAERVTVTGVFEHRPPCLGC